MKSKRRLAAGVVLVVVLLCGGFLLVRQERADILNAAIPPEERRMLAESPQFTLYSLLPPTHAELAEELKPIGKFHGFPILGQTQITDARTRQALLASLYPEIGRSEPAMCFNPRHGIRVVMDGKTLDLVICFACSQIEIYNGTEQHGATVSPVPKEVFNRAVTDAHLTLCPN